jgi:hypothetical protein
LKAVFDTEMSKAASLKGRNGNPRDPVYLLHKRSLITKPLAPICKDFLSRGQGKMLGKDCLRADQDLNIPCYVTIDT